MNRTLIYISLLALLHITTAFTQPDAQTYYESGMKAAKSKDYIKAIGEFTNAVTMRANFADAYMERAKAKIQLGEEMGFVNSEACSDLVLSLRYGHKDAANMLEKYCMGECFDTKNAFQDPEMVFCGDFSNKVLADLPDNISQLTNIIKLNLFNNKITYFSDKFSPLYTLISLDLSSNKITQITPTISKLTLLKELNLNKNMIAELPNEFGNLQELKYLYLRSNYITELPKSVAKLKSLETLDLSLNKLTTLPIEIANLKNLKTLILVGNDIPKEKQQIISSLLPQTKIYFE
ncbi:MAG: leucine-rich repeat domain-containing protein [Cytophagales bacterium]|nr:leucine-rich repeat domain-containing protein [Cytophagales bacterium]